MRQVLAAWRMAAAVLLCASASAAAQQSAGTQIVNVANASYRDVNGTVSTAAASAAVMVNITTGVEFVPNREVAAGANTSVVFAHRLTNSGSVADQFRFSFDAPLGWVVEIFIDDDGDGLIGAGDAPAGAAALDAGKSSNVLVRVRIPSDSAAGQGALIRITATSMRNAATSARVEDRITVVVTRAELFLGKSVDRSDAAAGDTVTYTLVARNQGNGAATGVVLVDTLPRGVTAVSLPPNGSAATTPDGRQVVSVALGALPPGQAANVQLRVVLGAGADESVRNVAHLTSATGGASSGPADVRLATPALRLAKDVVGDTSLHLNDTVTYRLRYANASPTTRARGVVLTDSLPAELQLVRAVGAELNGRVLRWRLPDLAPLDSGSLLVVARVVTGTPATRIVNVAVLEAINTRLALARAVGLVVRADEPLTISKSAAVLEVGPGEGIPYAVTVRNRSLRALMGVVIVDRLPPGLRLVGAPRGADSVRQSGDVVRLFVGALAPGARRDVHYGAVLMQAGRPRELRNVAWATADGGAVRSDSATATVRTRGQDVQGRTLVGKVFVDGNDNGRQDSGERGVAGVRVWGAEGEMVVSDADGRFSFRDVLPGSHALRLDTLALPGGARPPRGADLVRVVRTDGWTMPRVTFALRPAVQGGEGVPSTTVRQAGNVSDTSVRVAPLRTAAERDAEVKQAFVTGAPVRIFAPADGTVIGTNRLFVGVRGEPGMTVTLFDLGREIARGVLRPDGVQDFINVEITPGPHRIRVRMTNSMGRERWDSVAVHHAGRPDSLVVPREAVTIRTDATAPTPVRVRVLDVHGVPVAEGVQVTVVASGTTLDGADSDATSAGDQRRVDAGGWLTMLVRPARVPGPGRVRLAADRARGMVTVRTLPAVHALVAVGSAEVNVAGGGPSFGAVTMRGAVGGETSVSISYDSRRSTTDDRRLFGRELDVADGTRYVTAGDASDRRVLAPATGTIAARVERGFDWLEFGDVRPSGFAGDGRLLAYERAVTGVNGRMTTGAMTWHGFGSVTAQRLEQRQIRAMGSSGPFLLGADIRPGTERVFVEVRARDNAARVIDRRELQRAADYEISYQTGALLLRRTVPASDIGDNPIFLVALVERRGAGERKLVGGVRTELDVGRLLPIRSDRELTLGASVVRDEAGSMPAGTSLASSPLSVQSSGMSIVGADARVRQHGLEAELELLRANVADSGALAGRAEVRWRSSEERVGVDARWMRVGQGFGTSIDPRLSSAVDEMRVAGSLRIGDSARAELSHRLERFAEYGVTRRTTGARMEERLLGGTFSQELGLASDAVSAGPILRSGSALVGRMRLAHADSRAVWVEGARAMESSGGASPQPDRVAAGASWSLFRGTVAEARHEWVSPADAEAYQSTGLRLRGASPFGRLWGGIDRADAGRAQHSAVLGVEQELRFAKIWSLESAFERRMGVGAAQVTDPLRAMPFAGPEPDYWSASLGMSLLPGGKRPNATFRAEHRDGRDETSSRVSLAGDATVGDGGAVLARSEWRAVERSEALAAAAGRTSRDDRSLLGLALRPTASDLFDALATLEWRRTMNPLGGSTFADSTEHRRLIGATDAVWSPRPGHEVAVRYAVRWSAWGDMPSPMAQFAGARLERPVFGRFSARLDGRMLHELSSGAARWSAAPSLLLRLSPTLHLEGGHRFGDLFDADFAGEQHRFFATIGMRFTERLLTTPASFWRDRLEDGVR